MGRRHLFALSQYGSCGGDLRVIESICANGQQKDKLTRINAYETRRNALLPGLRYADPMKAALRVLVEAGWLRPNPTRDGNTSGRQRADYLVNPRIRERADG